MIDHSFNISKDIESYIFGIAKNLYFTRLKKQSKMVELIDDHQLISAESTPYLELLGKEKSKIYQTVLQQSTSSCRQVLILWSYGHRMGEIAEKLGYKSEIMARKKKHECIQKLIGLFKDNRYLMDQILQDE